MAALSGAMGAGLLVMVSEYSERAAGTDDPKPGLRSATEELVRLAEEDAEAYAAYSSARERRKEDPANWEKAKQWISRVPMSVLEVSLKAYATVPEILAGAPKWFSGDISIAVGCLEACMEGARSLCGANLGLLKGPGHDLMAAGLREAEARLEDLRRRIEPHLLARLPGR